MDARKFRQSQYKAKPSPERAKDLRDQQHKANRKNLRTHVFSKQRNMVPSEIDVSEVEAPVISTSPSSRLKRLRVWQAEKKAKKELMQRNKKPIFKVSVITHSGYSPPRVPLPLPKVTALLPHTPVPKVTRPISPPLGLLKGKTRVPKPPNLMGFSPKIRVTRSRAKLSQAVESNIKTPPVRVTRGDTVKHTNKKLGSTFKISLVRNTSANPLNIKNKLNTPPATTSEIILSNSPGTSKSNITTLSKTPLKNISKASTSTNRNTTITPPRTNINIRNATSSRNLTFSNSAVTPRTNVKIELKTPVNKTIKSKTQSTRTATNSKNITSTLKPVTPVIDININSATEYITSSISNTIPLQHNGTTPLSKEVSVILKDNISALDQIKCDNEVLKTPESLGSMRTYTSPFVTLTRGKGSVKRETKARKSLLPEEGSPEQLALEGNYFRTVLNNEIERLVKMCDEWSNYKEATELKQYIDAEDSINAVVGHTKLLINKKFEQFRGLIHQCETQEGEQKVTTMDLQGFWDMIFKQVEDLDLRFNKLTTLRDNNWEEECKVVEKKQIVKRKVAAKRFKGTSNLKALIKAARTKAKPAGNELLIPGNSFDGGFFKVVSPIPFSKRTPARSNQSLLISVLSMEAKKQKSVMYPKSPFTLSRVSDIAKKDDPNNPDFVHEPKSPVVYINRCTTPSRSILKTPGLIKSSGQKMALSQTKMVLFSDSGNYSDNELSKTELNTNTSLRSVVELTRIDSALIDMLEAPADVEKMSKTFTEKASIQTRASNKENIRESVNLISWATPPSATEEHTEQTSNVGRRSVGKQRKSIAVASWESWVTPTSHDDTSSDKKTTVNRRSARLSQKKLAKQS